MATVSLNRVVKNYGDERRPVIAVNAIDLEIRDREFMVLVGPSGCGKSTSLRMIAGLEDVSFGEICIDGRVVNDVPSKDRDLAMVFQNYALYPHMSVYDNMAFGLLLRKFPQIEIERRVMRAAKILGIEAYLDRKPKALSGGQRQRVAVGRAIVRDPKVFLFDEPLSNLDAKMRNSMRSEISKLHDRLESTMIYVTHDQVEAMTMGDRICVMKDGNIMQVDEPMEIYSHPQNLFVAGFIGSPPMNFFRGRIERNGDGRGFSFFEDAGNEGGGRLVVPLESRHDEALSQTEGIKVVLGVRPECVLLGSESEGRAFCGQLEAIVDVIEPMGAETHLFLRSSGSIFIARIQGGLATRPKDRFSVAIDGRTAHLFEASSERLIVGPERIRIAAMV